VATHETVVERTVAGFAEIFDTVVANVSRFLKGKEAAIRLALVCLASEGHLLVEDVPGVGKTSLAKALARSLSLDWQRIQFTPDLLPSDVTGVSVFDRNTASFIFRPGGVFANVVLGDEINRASPKTQSALLEAMEERQVTVDSKTYHLPDPFLVIATQNPLEHHGTYPLPESQLDRFLMRIRMGYPDRGSEMAMLDRPAAAGDVDDLPPVVDSSAVSAMVALAGDVHMAPAVKSYIIDVATSTRHHRALALGMSPRATLALQRAARSLAASVGRSYVVPDDVKALVVPVLEHRLTLTPEAQLAGTRVIDVLRDVLHSVAIPSGRPSG
jgi:MoxR-like ATPase